MGAGVGASPLYVYRRAVLPPMGDEARRLTSPGSLDVADGYDASHVYLKIARGDSSCSSARRGVRRSRTGVPLRGLQFADGRRIPSQGCRSLTPATGYAGARLT